MTITAARTAWTVECEGDQRRVAVMLREVREQLGLTQKEVAQRLRRTQSMVARWESGQHEFTLATLARLAEALGCDLTLRFPGREGRQ